MIALRRRTWAVLVGPRLRSDDRPASLLMPAMRVRVWGRLSVWTWRFDAGWGEAR